MQVPLKIEDEPKFVYRGVMIDSARHFLSVGLIEKTIDALMLNKLNVLHWHIVDDESFPIKLKNLTQISEYSAYSSSEVFTYEDFRHILQYARKRGVAIVPEIDTPGHTWSWGKSESLSDIIIQCGKQYGQFDPTMEKTYDVVTSVFTEFAEIFGDDVPFVHFGGDEIVKSCWNKRPSIKKFMDENGIADYEEMEAYYRRRQKEIWTKTIGSKKNVAYWTNPDVNLPTEENDIIHWWGLTEELEHIANKTNRIILSDYNTLYLDTGSGNAFSNHYSDYHTWRDIYRFNPFPENISGTVIGGEACLWGEVNSESTHFNKLFIRTSVLAQRLWNPEAKEATKFSDFVASLVQQERRLVRAGIQSAPVTSDYCARNTDVCFPEYD